MNSAFLLLMIPLLMLTMTGCFGNQSSVQVVQDVLNYLPTVQVLDQQFGSVVNTLLQSNVGDAEYLNLLKSVSTDVNNGLTAVNTLGQAYVASPSSATFGKIVDAIDAATVSVDNNMLKTLHVSNPTTQTEILIGLGLLSGSMHVIQTQINAHATKAQLKAVAKARLHPKLKEVSAYWNYDMLNYQLSRIQVSCSDAVHAVGSQLSGEQNPLYCDSNHQLKTTETLVAALNPPPKDPTKPKVAALNPPPKDPTKPKLILSMVSMSSSPKESIGYPPRIRYAYLN